VDQFPLFFFLFLRLGVSSERRARAEHMGVSVHVIQSSDSWPEFVLSEVCHGVSSLLTCVFAAPGIGDHLLSSVGSVLEDVVSLVDRSSLHLRNLSTNGDQSIAQTVQLVQRLTLSGFNHQSTY